MKEGVLLNSNLTDNLQQILSEMETISTEIDNMIQQERTSLAEIETLYQECNQGIESLQHKLSEIHEPEHPVEVEPKIPDEELVHLKHSLESIQNQHESIESNLVSLSSESQDLLHSLEREKEEWQHLLDSTEAVRI